MFVLLFAGTALADWSSWGTTEAPAAPYSGNDIPTEPRLAVDDGFVHLAFTSRYAASSTTEVWYNTRDPPPASQWRNLPPSFPFRLSNSGVYPGTAHEPDVAVHEGRIDVVWSQWTATNPPTPGDYRIHFRESADNGGSWGADTIISSTAASHNPSVAVDEDGIYVVWSQVTGALGNRISVWAKSVTSGASCTTTLYTTDPGWNDERPRLTLDKVNGQHVKNLVFQRRYDADDPDDDTKDDTWEVYGARSITTDADDCGGWTDPPVRLSANHPTNLDTDSVTPSITHALGRYAHLVWEDRATAPSRIVYRGSGDLGASWEPEMRLLATDPLLLGQSQPSVAACATCVVGVLFTQALAASQSVYFQWSVDRGVTWQTNPIALGNPGTTAPSLASDDLVGTGDTLIYGLHGAWDLQSGTLHSVNYRPSDSGSPPAAGPEPPTNLRVSAGPGGAALTWTASSSPGVVGYNIYRSMGNQPDPPTNAKTGFDFRVRLSQVPGTGFSDASLFAQTKQQLYYVLRSVLADGTEGPTSYTAGVWRRAFPAGLVTWALPLEPFAIYRVSDYAEPGGPVSIASVDYVRWMDSAVWITYDPDTDTPGNSHDAPVTLGMGMEIRLTATSTYAFVGWAANQVRLTNCFALPQPVNFRLTVPAPGDDVRLDWDPVIGAQSYSIYRALTRAEAYNFGTPFATTTSPTWTDVGVNGNDPALYRQQAYYLVAPSGPPGIGGHSTWSLGKWTATYTGLHAIALPALELEETGVPGAPIIRGVGWYCPRMMAQYIEWMTQDGSGTWVPHGCPLGEGVYDAYYMAGLGYQIHVQATRMFTYEGF